MKHRIEFDGQDVYVGIDTHKEKYVYTAIYDNQIVKRVTFNGEQKEFVKALLHTFKGAKLHTAYEAGFIGNSLHRRFEERGVNNIVVNPASIEVATNDKVKTDKRDSKKIAEQLCFGRLKPNHIPSKEQELCRKISRGRTQFVEKRKAVGNQIKATIYEFDLMHISSKKKMSESLLKKIETLPVGDELEFYLTEMIDEWRHLSQKIKLFGRKLKEQAMRDKNEEILRSVPGVGEQSSRTLSNELGDMSHFKSKRAAYCYTGLTPGEHSSGGHTRRGHISRQGSSRLRAILVEIAWRAIRKDHSLKEMYDRIKSTRGGKRAIVGVARAMIGRIRKCLMTNELWQSDPA
jgi:transposase